VAKLFDAPNKVGLDLAGEIVDLAVCAQKSVLVDLTAPFGGREKAMRAQEGRWG
jgi:hypothetical protein